jgi:hypothetical protein
MMKTFMSETYQKQKPFAGFLPGIAGKEGLPMWVFYVNRGQAVTSFGVRDKNGAIAEFYPANLAYAYVHQQGFRTFIKFKNEVYECFQEKNLQQTFSVDAHQIILEETIVSWNIKIRITFATLPNMPISALMRKVELINLDKQTKEITIVDGLSQMLPAGIDYGGYKAISNLLQSWMEVEESSNHVFLKLRASTADSSEVKAIEEGNFYSYFGLNKFAYLYDYKAVFAQDSAFNTPYQLINHDFESLSKQIQAPVNQVPSAFVVASIALKDQQTFYGLFGYSQQRPQLTKILNGMSAKTIEEKFFENQQVVEALTKEIKTETAMPMFDSYLQQCYLDNILRGGYPLTFKTLDGEVGYHIYSRKHGDLERDYNFFSIEPSYLSQGNGAFRDVLQNRRNDLYFHPESGRTTIAQFASLLQADGYNPLSIEGIQFTFAGKVEDVSPIFASVLKAEFTPGQIANLAGQQGLPVIPTVEKILSQSHYHFKATYGEGYWGDHFTYFIDLLETYLDIFPDHIKPLLSQKHAYFVSPASVLKRSEKYVLKSGKIRQYHAVHHDHQGLPRGWLKLNNGETLKTSLLAKLITLVANKFAQLDPEEFGLMYEADRPGWNDAMNGVPGLFGSGVSEMFELKRLLVFLTKLSLEDTEVITPLIDLIQSLVAIKDPNLFNRWQMRMNALETYRDALKQPLTLTTLSGDAIKQFLQQANATLTQSIARLETLNPIPYTYFSYEVTDYTLLPMKENNPTQFIQAKGFKRHAIPLFLEAPARLLSSGLSTIEKANQLYKTIKVSPLYDAPLKIYKTSVSLADESMEIGRIRAFTPGWLERESAFLHMTYKYLLGLLKAEAYDAFFEAMHDGLTCFMDPLIYGRSPLENSSFIATTNNPDSSKHGQGFFARLSGSTAEVISMWKRMIFGRSLFFLQDDKLSFQIKPLLTKDFFINGKIESRLFSDIQVTILYQGHLPTFDSRIKVAYYEVKLKSIDQIQRVDGPVIQGNLAQQIRDKLVTDIRVFLEGGTP